MFSFSKKITNTVPTGTISANGQITGAVTGYLTGNTPAVVIGTSFTATGVNGSATFSAGDVVWLYKSGDNYYLALNRKDARNKVTAIPSGGAVTGVSMGLIYRFRRGAVLTADGTGKVAYVAGIQGLPSNFSTFSKVYLNSGSTPTDVVVGAVTTSGLSASTEYTAWVNDLD